MRRLSQAFYLLFIILLFFPVSQNGDLQAANFSSGLGHLEIGATMWSLNGSSRANEQTGYSPGERNSVNSTRSAIFTFPTRSRIETVSEVSSPAQSISISPKFSL